MIVRRGGKYCGANSITGRIFTRRGRKACFSSRALAVKDLRNTECRVVRMCPPGTTTQSLITEKGRRAHARILAGKTRSR